MSAGIADDLIQDAIHGSGDRAPKASGAGFMDYIDKGLSAYEKGRSKIDQVSNFVSNEDVNNIRNGIGGVMGLAGRKNPESRSLYPGEKHGVVLSGDYKGSAYNYLGGGTRLRERLNRGDRPINDLDAAALIQDKAYAIAKTGADIRLADVAAMDAFERSRDDPLAGRAAAKLIQAKMIAERGIRLDLGLDAMQFAGENPPVYRDDIGAIEGGGLPGDRLRAYAKALKKRNKKRNH